MGPPFAQSGPLAGPSSSWSDPLLGHHLRGVIHCWATICMQCSTAGHQQHGMIHCWTAMCMKWGHHLQGVIPAADCSLSLLTSSHAWQVRCSEASVTILLRSVSVVCYLTKHFDSACQLLGLARAEVRAHRCCCCAY